MIKVFICANSTAELDRLKALITSTSSLKLVGSSLGRASLRQQLADAHADVLLEHSLVVDLDELRSEDVDAKPAVYADGRKQELAIGIRIGESTCVSCSCGVVGMFQT